MKKSNYVLYRAIKRAAASNEELYDSYAEALEFAAETGYGLADGSIAWDSLEPEELAAAAAPEMGRDVACTVLYCGEGVRRLRSPLDLKEGDEVMAKYWVEGNLYLVVEPDPES